MNSVKHDYVVVVRTEYWLSKTVFEVWRLVKGPDEESRSLIWRKSVIGESTDPQQTKRFNDLVTEQTMVAGQERVLLKHLGPGVTGGLSENKF